MAVKGPRKSLFNEIDPNSAGKVIAAYCHAVCESAKAMKAPRERGDALEEAVYSPRLRKCKERETLITDYLAAREQQLSCTEDKPLRIWLLNEILESSELKKTARFGEYTKERIALMKDGTLKAEMTASLNYWELVRMLNTANKSQLSNASKLRDQLVQKFTDTIAAKKAKELVIPKI